MAKDTKKQDSAKKLRRKLAKYNHKLRLARDAYAMTRAEGEQRIQEARIGAERALTKSAREVERRAEKVSRLEEMLLTIDGPREGDGTVPSPEAAADLLETEASETSSGDDSGLALPESVR